MLLVKETLRQMLKSCRKKMSYSQRDVSEKTGIPQPTYARTESGQRIPRKTSELEALSKVLDIPLKKLLFAVTIENRKHEFTDKLCPETIRIFSIASMIMTDKELYNTFYRIERRINYFKEDPIRLAKNLALYLTGKLNLDDEPSNGLRPLRHYICPITPEIDTWSLNKLGGDEMN